MDSPPLSGVMGRDKPEVPQHPKRSLPDRDRPCPGCGTDHDRRDLEMEREPYGSTGMYRSDFWCPDCGSYVGGRVMYEGPIPVETHRGTEWH